MSMPCYGLPGTGCHLEQWCCHGSMVLPRCLVRAHHSRSYCRRRSGIPWDTGPMSASGAGLRSLGISRVTDCSSGSAPRVGGGCPDCKKQWIGTKKHLCIYVISGKGVAAKQSHESLPTSPLRPSGWRQLSERTTHVHHTTAHISMRGTSNALDPVSVTLIVTTNAVVIVIVIIIIIVVVTVIVIPTVVVHCGSGSGHGCGSGGDCRAGRWRRGTSRL